MKTLSINDVNKINDHHRVEEVALVTKCTVITCKQGMIFEPSQVLIKKQQPEVSGLGVASFTDQNSGWPWTHVNTAHMEVMSYARQ